MHLEIRESAHVDHKGLVTIRRGRFPFRCPTASCFAGVLACRLVCLLAGMLTGWFVGLLACLLGYGRACLLACLLSGLPSRLLAGWLV